MSDNENINELDNYGVWVKKPPKDIEPSEPSDSSDPFDFDSDLPNFDSLDASLDFDLEDSNSDTTIQPESQPLDIAITEADLAVDETPADEDVTADIFASTTEPDFDNDMFAESLSDSDTPVVEEPVADIPLSPVEEEPAVSFDDMIVEEPAVEDVSDMFNDEPAAQDTPVEAPVQEETVEVSADSFDLDSMPDGEIDLGDFLSDDSAPSAPSGTTDVTASFEGDGEIDLGDFMDGGFSEFSGGDPTPKQEEVVDEDPLDINLDFDESADSFSVEEDEKEEAIEITSETVSTSSAEPSVRSTGESIDTETIDLGDFIDDSEEDQGLTKGPEGLHPAVETQVDYEMNVTADSDDEKPVSMSDVVRGNIDIPDSFDEEAASLNMDEPVAEETPEPEAAVEEPAAAPQAAAISDASRELLQQIMGEFTSLKDEIKNLKSDLEKIKNGEEQITVPEEENTGFFSDDSQDETIALSGDELDNILNNADFVEDNSKAEESEIAIEESSVSEEPAMEEPVVEETPAADEPVIVENDAEDAMSDDQLSSIDIDSVMEEPAETTESAPAPQTADNSYDLIIEDQDLTGISEDFEETEDQSLDIDDDFDFGESTEAVTESEEAEETQIESELPDEIEIPKIEEESVENNDSAATAFNLTDDDIFGEQEEVNEPVIEDTLEDSIIDTPVATTEEVEEPVLNSAPNLDDIFEDDSLEKTFTNDKMDYLSKDIDESEVMIDEPQITESEPEVVDNDDDDIFAETSVEEPVIETPETEPAVEEAPAEPEAEPQPEIEVEPQMPVAAASAPADNEIPGDLKNEIKSVLSYMDQLLENLPEDKISEFAQSEQFVTYKKLFQELGLS
ncbi:MAG: hypothetical protein MJ169_06890 [Treponema sp.]|nr:hypothetical protein [Treponema sp.]